MPEEELLVWLRAEESGRADEARPDTKGNLSIGVVRLHRAFISQLSSSKRPNLTNREGWTLRLDQAAESSCVSLVAVRLYLAS